MYLLQLACRYEGDTEKLPDSRAQKLILSSFFTLHRILADRKRNYFYTKYDRIAGYDHREAIAATTLYTVLDITNSRQYERSQFSILTYPDTSVLCEVRYL